MDKTMIIYKMAYIFEKGRFYNMQLKTHEK